MFRIRFLLPLTALVAAVALAQEDPAAFRCPEPFGYFPDQNNCHTYYICAHGRPIHEQCEAGLQFSEVLKTCDWPRNVDCDRRKQHSPNQSLNNL